MQSAKVNLKALHQGELKAILERAPLVGRFAGSEVAV